MDRAILTRWALLGSGQGAPGPTRVLSTLLYRHGPHLGLGSFRTLATAACRSAWRDAAVLALWRGFARPERASSSRYGLRKWPGGCCGSVYGAANRCLSFIGFLRAGACVYPRSGRGQAPAFYRQVKASIPTRALRVTLFAPDSPLQSVQQELAGFKRVMTGYSTVMIDLAQSTETLRSAMEGKWRNRLVRAEAEGSLKVFVNASPPQVRWLLAREGEQRATRNFRGLPTEFVQA